MAHSPTPYQTSFLQGLGLTVIYCLKGQPGWIIAALVVLIIGLTPVVGEKYHELWMWIAKSIGKLNGWILLSVFYVLVVIPIGLIRKLAGKDPLKLKPVETESFFTERNHTYTAKNLKDPW